MRVDGPNGGKATLPYAAAFADVLDPLWAFVSILTRPPAVPSVGARSPAEQTNHPSMQRITIGEVCGRAPGP